MYFKYIQIMKRIFILTTAIFLAFNIFSQSEENIRKETFNSNAFGWEEIVTKKKSALIQDGYLVLKATAKDPITITTRFPMDVQRSFKITAKFLLPQYKFGSPVFGIVFDEPDAIRRFVIGNFVDGKKLKHGAVLNVNGKVETMAMPFNFSKKNAEVIITIENRGGTLSFSVNGMTVFTDVKISLNTSNWGFAVAGGEVKVDEIIICQVAEY